MSYKKQLENMFEENEKKRAVKNKTLFPYSIKYLREVMGTPENVRGDAEAWLAWVKQNRKRRLRVYLKYFSRHFWGGTSE